ncbi:phosphatidate cytidylyltransferase [Roseibium litorale]|uniref:Phosphatidate cytidylyltransferase n=1 Tax=Roseibium litorale TaxID=2803841 RepID=A0ABR9CJP4_9HYPH|nr:phosphatidate cytidylyltransferase [Roseibium litorale]MBD8891062.1 phosphatidate cytidylyltransferase [Roseibium litorale]
MADLRARVLSALVLGPAVLALSCFGGAPYDGLVLVAGVLILWEWFTITGTIFKSPSGLAGLLALAASGLSYHLGLPIAAFGLVLAGMILCYILGKAARTARWGAEGVLYAGLSMLALMAVRRGDLGQVFIFFLLVVIWATDICAYFVGRFLGGPKLWTRVSPNKTWSGALGGLTFAVLFGGGFVLAAGQTEPLGWMLLAGLLSIVSQIGDLAESALKRRFKVKDSSQLIPGHGGVMDRVDGLVAAAVFAAFLGLAFGGELMDPVSALGLM